MTAHLGILALMVVVAGALFVRSRRPPQLGDRVLLALTLAAALAEVALLFAEPLVGGRWETAARNELVGRVDRVVRQLREEGAAALAQVRAIGDDPDTRTLLADAESREIARRPVFNDVLERFPEGGSAGVTLYDRAGRPRAWGGWSPPATMFVAREPEHRAETVGIRQGNIYTLLEVVHPVADSAGAAIGFVVYQRPLRVQYPLESRLLHVEDALQSLEGGAGAHADVALVFDVVAGADVRSLRTGSAKLDVREDFASCSAAIVTGSGAAVGHVSLTGLSRSGWIADRLAPFVRVRNALLALVGMLVVVRAWSASGALPRVAAPLVRIALVIAGRLALNEVIPRLGVSSWSVFDPTSFASIRWSGLLRSPGDVLLTAGALLLAFREARRLLMPLEDRIRIACRPRRFLPAIPAVLIAFLAGSAVAKHWSLVVDVARNANVPLYDGLDPFTSAPVATIEAALLAAAIAFLILGDSLAGLCRALVAALPRPVGAGMLVACTWLASAAKMGTPTQLVAADFTRPIPALVALVAFHAFARRRTGSAAATVLGAALLASVANFAPLREGSESRRRDIVELFATDHTESPSSSRQFLLERVAGHLCEAMDLREALRAEPDLGSTNLAFILWAKSPLSSLPAGSFLRFVDARGRVYSEFSLGFPPELVPAAVASPVRRSVRFGREEIGAERVDLYSADAPITDEGRLLGTVQLSIAWFDELGRPSGAPRVVPGILSTLSSSPEYRMFVRNLPERIDRYRDDRHVSSTDLEEGLMPRLPSTMVVALRNSTGEGLWEPREIGRSLWDLYCVRERDGERTVGYLTFGLRRHGLGYGLWLFARSALVALVLAVIALAILAGLGRIMPGRAGGVRLQLPRFGFRERVIGGFLLVSLVPTVFLGVLGRNLVVQQKQQQFRAGLEEDLRVARELVGRRLVDAARNAAASDPVRSLLAGQTERATLSTPASVDGVVVTSASGQVLASSRGADTTLAALSSAVDVGVSPVEFFHRPKESESLVACAVVPIRAGAGSAPWRVLAFERIDARLAADLERRVGSPVSFFAGGRLTATSKPELYRSEILSDLVDPRAYVRIELEGSQRVFQATRTGATSLLAGYAPLRNAEGRPAGVVSALAPHPEGLDPEAAAVLSRIYFLCLFVIAAAITGAMLLANRLTRPITELTEGAEKIRAGRLGARIAWRATGEIGRLIRSFNLMSVQLAESETRDRERREYIEAIIRHVGSGVVSFDASGRVATVNEAAARILSVRADALLGMSAMRPSGDSSVQAVCAAVRPLLEGAGREVVQELEVPDPRDAAAEPRMLRLVATPLVDREGRPQGAVAVFEDLTDLVRSKKITAWAQMARQVAHEIKNPLTPMKLSAQHLRQAWRDRHPKFDRILEESTETIVDRCEALRRIAIEFSDYARMPGRRVRREDLGRLLREAHRLYGEADGRGVEFRLDTPDGELYSRVDRDEVMRLFINLIENSIQAMPEGGDLEVRAARENGAACVTIRDSGVGIPTENLARIFEPSFSTKTGGAGLGLPICKAIMEDYGGSISIASVAGEGTTVTLKFPVDESRTQPPES